MTIDRQLVSQRFGNALKTYDASAVAQEAIAKRLARLLSERMSLSPETIFEIGCGTGLLTAELHSYYPEAHFVLNDLVKASEGVIKAKLPLMDYDFMTGDAENMSWQCGYSLIASSSVIQWWDAPTHFIDKAFHSLQDGGWLAVSTFLPDNLFEITPLLSESLPYPEAKDYGKALSVFRFSEIVEESITIHFPTLYALLKHLKSTGTNALPIAQKGLLTPRRLKTMEASIRSHLGLNESELIPLTYRAIIIIAQK